MAGAGDPVIGAGALGLCWRLLVREHRRVTVAAADAARRATRDPLTGLSNRDALRSAFDARHAAGEPFALLVIDLDRFKQVNDTLGHHAGDALLVAVADRLRLSVRGDDLVARLGGDEFAVLLSTIAGVDRVAGQIRDGVADLTLAYDVTVGASVGAACWPDDAQTYDELVAAADAAMYRAKRRTRSVVALPTAVSHNTSCDEAAIPHPVSSAPRGLTDQVRTEQPV